jgi:hypothetical protein
MWSKHLQQQQQPQQVQVHCDSSISRSSQGSSSRASGLNKASILGNQVVSQSAILQQQLHTLSRGLLTCQQRQ